MKRFSDDEMSDEENENCDIKPREELIEEIKKEKQEVLTRITINSKINFSKIIENTKLLSYFDEMQEMKYENFRIFNKELEKNDIKLLMMALNEKQELKEMSFHSNHINNDQAKYIFFGLLNKNKLEYLDFSHNDIWNNGIKIICYSLKDTRKLRHLNLSFNFIGNLGAKALAEAFENLPDLAEIYLNDNTIGDEGFSAILDSLKNNNSNLKIMNFSNNGITREGGSKFAEFLKEIKSVEEVILSGNNLGQSAHKILESVKQNNNLKKLRVNACSIPYAIDKSITNILEQRKLRT